MTKTSLDVCTRALTRIGVLGIGEDPTAEDFSEAQSVMQGVVDELTGVHGITIPWTIETVPDVLFLPMADLVAAEIASTYGPQVAQMAPSRVRAIGRIKANMWPDDREDYRDIDDDGTVDDEEVEAGERARFY